jgi:hypothetical protein
VSAPHILADVQTGILLWALYKFLASALPQPGVEYSLFDDDWLYGQTMDGASFETPLKIGYRRNHERRSGSS